MRAVARNLHPRRLSRRARGVAPRQKGSDFFAHAHDWRSRMWLQRAVFGLCRSRYESAPKNLNLAIYHLRESHTWRLRGDLSRSKAIDAQVCRLPRRDEPHGRTAFDLFSTSNEKKHFEILLFLAFLVNLIWNFIDLIMMRILTGIVLQFFVWTARMVRSKSH